MAIINTFEITNIKNLIPEIDILNISDYRYMIMKTDGIISKNLSDHGFFEKHLIEISNVLISENPTGNVIDVGANLGSYSIPLAKLNPNINIYAFEPQRIIYYQFCGNIFLNRLKNIDAQNCALGNEAKEIISRIPFYNKLNNIGAFSLDKEVSGKEEECFLSDETEEMYITTLDSLDIENIRLIKIDVEGMEKEVLQGSLNTLIKNNYPPIIFEAWTYKEWYQERRKDLYRFLEELDYEISIIGENNIAQHNSKSKIKFTLVDNTIKMEKES